MAVRPGQIRYLKEGKAVGAKSHKGFVATWNWVLSWIDNFRVGPGLHLSGAGRGRPRLSLALLNADGAPIDDGGEDTPAFVASDPDDFGGGGAPAIPGPFEPVYTNGVISGCANCVFCAGRSFVDAGSLSVSATSSSTGYVILTLTHPTSANASWAAANASLSVSAHLPGNSTDTQTQIPLYHITNGVVDVDLRAVPTGVLAQ